MDASDSMLSSVKSSSFLLITRLTILSALFITTLAVNHELHDPIRTGEMVFFTHWILIVISVGLIALSNCYKADGGKKDRTKRQYQLAANIAPGKFHSNYPLIKLHDETGQHNKVASFARNLLKKEIKVLSPPIAEMMVELEQITTNNNTESTSNNKEKGKNYTYKDQIGFKLQFW